MDTLAIIKRIEMRLSEIGMSKAEFYKQSGISSASLSQWRTGTYKPTEKKLSSAAICLGVSLNYLISGQMIDEQLSLSNGICVFRSFDPNKIDSMLADFFEPNSYRIAYRAPGIAITVSNDASATDAEIDTIVNANRVDSVKTEKAPTETGERSVSDAELKFALWGNSEDMDDDDLADVRRYAAFVRERKKDRK